MPSKELIAAVMGEAAKSNVEKRKVGCVIVDSADSIVGVGHNIEDWTSDNVGMTQNVAHAEYMALTELYKLLGTEHPEPSMFKAYVSHEPCPDCALRLLRSNIEFEVIKPFMKFDGDKLRYDLIPPETLKALAEVYTFGARKYKPNNWKECDDTSRYVAALYRHLEAWRAGEQLDEETGFNHLAHAMTNLSFLHYLEKNNDNG